MKVKEESEKVGLKLNIQKTKVMASCPSLHGILPHHFMEKRRGKKWKQWQILFTCTPKSPWMVTAAMKLKDTCSLEEKLWHPSAPAPRILHQTWTGNSFLIWYYTCFHAIPPNHPPPPTESKRLFYTSVSLLLSHIQGYCYHLSKFHIYALVYCIGVFLSGLLHSV